LPFPDFGSPAGTSIATLLLPNCYFVYRGVDRGVNLRSALLHAGQDLAEMGEQPSGLRRMPSITYQGERKSLFPRDPVSGDNRTRQGEQNPSSGTRYWISLPETRLPTDPIRWGRRSVDDIWRLGYWLPTDLTGPNNIVYGLIDFSALAPYEEYRKALTDDLLHQRIAEELTRSRAVINMERSIIQRYADTKEQWACPMIPIVWLDPVLALKTT
jgi:hypothetical protein